jgi:16S rRNA (guanine527-N7)-methyltransferase
MAVDRVGVRLAELAGERALSAAQAAQLSSLLEILQDDGRAPTSSATRSADAAVDVHVADSLTALALAPLAAARKLTDLGSGAGLPGLVLAIALPQAEVRLLESQTRKCAFIDGAARQIGLQNARAVCSRAEQWAAGAGGSDVVTARAVAAQPVVLEYAAPLLALGGSLIDWRGARDPAEELAADRAAEELGLRRVEICSTRPFAGSRDHHLHVFAKVAPTPERFPRRAGVARKRPLGG